jgi:hypothetical protein
VAPKQLIPGAQLARSTCPAWILGPVLPDFPALDLAGWEAVAQLVLAVTAFVALIGAFVQILTSRSATRQTLTYNFTERFSRPELIPYLRLTNELFTERTLNENDRYDWYQGWSYENKLAALVVPNLIEELAGMYNQGLLHKGIAKDYFGETARELWSEGWWFIKRFRDTDQNFYAQWLLMLKDMGLDPELT